VPSSAPAVVTYQDFLEVEAAFDEVRGVRLLRRAFRDASPRLRIGLIVSAGAACSGLIGNALSVALGADGAWWWAAPELLGSFALGALITHAVDGHFVKHVGRAAGPGALRTTEQLQALRFAQLVPPELQRRELRASLLEFVDAEFEGRASVIGAHPLVLFLVAVTVGLVGGWAGQEAVWTSGLGFMVLASVLLVLVWLSLIPEVIAHTHRRRAVLRSLIRRLP
jgi:hypothetical protein